VEPLLPPFEADGVIGATGTVFSAPRPCSARAGLRLRPERRNQVEQCSESLVQSGWKRVGADAWNRGDQATLVRLSVEHFDSVVGDHLERVRMHDGGPPGLSH
jgi:hypothetical protein